MNAATEKLCVDVPTIIGTPWEGGFFGGIFTIGTDAYAQVIAPKALGDLSGIWHPKYTDIAGASSFNDGVVNTIAMAEAGSEIAQRILELRIDGRDDWHIGARDAVELQYRHFKPTDDGNYVHRSGDNPSSLPPGYPYAIHLPGQTAVDLFRKGAAEAFKPTWYWSSTQFSAYGAWYQNFGGGLQNDASKLNSGRARAVRRIKIS